jgi:hypothetical protein
MSARQRKTAICALQNGVLRRSKAGFGHTVDEVRECGLSCLDVGLLRRLNREGNRFKIIMNSVSQSLALLEDALGSLERSLATRLQAEAAQYASLSAEHAALQADYAALKAVAGRASETLEQTLTRIDRYLKVAADGAG